MKKIVFASNNQNKIKEINKLLPEDIQILSLQDIGCVVDIPETAPTIEGNALLKADFVKRHYGYDCFADDSGLEIDFLNKEPGVYSARYAGQDKDDQKNIEKVLHKMVEAKDRKANFKTVITLHYKGQTHHFTGLVHGEITTQQIGHQGFGYDPIFKPQGYEQTFAQMSLDQKNHISHRAIAVKQLVEFLENCQ